MTTQLKLNNELKQTVKICGCIQDLSKQIKALPNYESYKNSIELLLSVCNGIEQFSFDEKLHKTDKLDILLNVYTDAFDVWNESDEVILKEAVEFLHKNGRIKASKYGKVWKVLKKLLCFLGKFGARKSAGVVC